MGTLRVPDTVPSPTQDCEKINNAFKGWGTDEKGLIWILGHRNASQRKKIKETYEQLYKQPLIKDIESELSGDFGRAVILWAHDPHERDAILVNKALKSRNKGLNQLQVIVEIACASSPHHLVGVRQAYCSLFELSLEEDIVSNVSLPVRKILVNMVSSYRYDKELVNSEIANIEAEILHAAIKKKQLDHDNLVMILGTRNVFQLKETFQCYKKNYGSTIDQDIKNCGNGILESILKVVIWCIESPEKHFAEVIRTSIIGFGTDEDALTRAIVTRAEIDMVKIKEEYQKAYKSSLDNAVKGDTSGYYLDFLMTLLGGKL